MIKDIGSYSTSKPLELTGLSTDTKPIETFRGVKIEQGSTFLEIDTQTVYFYDEANKRWHG